MKIVKIANMCWCCGCRAYLPQDKFYGISGLKSSSYCIEHRKAASKKWARTNRVKVNRYTRRDRLRTKYGLTEEEAKVLYDRKICDICKQPPRRHLNIDHDHSDGRIRGVLCEDCNRGLGMFRDDAARMQNAVHYLLTN